MKAALRTVLNGCGMSNAQIAAAVAGPLREIEVGANYPGVVAAMAAPNNLAFANAFDQAITNLGGVWNPPVWNLAALGLTPPLSMVAVEECSAISKYARTNAFDAVKALTNILRMIKAP